MKRALAAAAVALVVLAAQSAHADPESEAQEHFKRGVKLYNLGHFQEAIPEFEKAYDFDPQPILLFNIAQSHRQNGNKERALFFYRRYLEQEPNTAKRADVEQRMKELAQALQQENEQKQKPPTEVTPPPPTAAPATPPAAGPAAPPVVTAGPPPPASAIPVRLALALGPSFATVSSTATIDVPVLFGFELGASYDFLTGPSELRAGAEMLYAALPYKTVPTSTVPSTDASSSFWGALVTVDYAYRVLEPLSIGGGVAGGVVWWAGLADGNPFTASDAVVSGAIPMPSFQVSLHADYRLTPHLFLTFQPSFLYSKATGAGLTKQTSSVERFDLDFGAGYRF